MTNALYYGDNLDVLRNEIASESVDLIYLDPPFNSQASYNVLFKGEPSYPDSVRRLLHYAAGDLGCSFVLFDCAGDVLDSFPTYDDSDAE